MSQLLTVELASELEMGPSFSSEALNFRRRHPWVIDMLVEKREHRARRSSDDPPWPLLADKSQHPLPVFLAGEVPIFPIGASAPQVQNLEPFELQTSVSPGGCSQAALPIELVKPNRVCL